MKILVLTSTYSRYKNDTEPKFVDNLCQQLSGDNTIHVVAPHAKGLLKEENLDGIPVYRFRYCFESWQTLAYDGGILPNLKQNPLRLMLVPLFIISQLVLTAQLVRRNHYDIIHAHWIIPQGIVAILARTLTKSRPAIVLTSHGGDLFALKGAFFSRLKKWITQHADSLTVVSSAMKRKAVELGLKEESRIAEIPMGVDTYGTFVPPSEGTSRKGLLFVGRLVDKKGIEYLLNAMPIVLAKYPMQNLTVIGDGPLKKSLAAQCDQLDIANRVHFTGSFTNPEIPAHLQTCEIAIFPSIVTDSGDQEGTPVAIMEALACGCATIASEYPGVRDIITDGETGLIVAGKSSEALAQGILLLLDSPELQQQLNENGRKNVQAHYDWQVIGGKFLALFQTLAERP